ncbi:MAG: AraC family transcriptional regulator [Lachnospiraceae bacterium]|nr:AraC family transcriptional regulator [Lachnospiraceae bacterium]
MGEKYAPLNVQCFVRRELQSVFNEKNDPKLLYVSQISPTASTHPRVMHHHKDHTEIILVCEGQSEYLIDDKQYHIEKGDLLIYNPMIVHDEISGKGNEVGTYCIAIGNLHMPDLPEYALIPSDAGFIFKTGDDFGELHTLLRMMYESLAKDEPRCEAFANSLMHAVLVKTLAIAARETSEHVEENKLEDAPILGRRIKKYIDDHYSEDISLQSMGTALNMSPYYISHVFKEMSGYSPMQYLLRRRVGEAQTLLISTDLPIAEIAGMVGYDTQSYFNLQFSKHVGIPPKKYRQNYIVENKGRHKK